jgi:hypothetical protein
LVDKSTTDVKNIFNVAEDENKTKFFLASWLTASRNISLPSQNMKFGGGVF